MGGFHIIFLYFHLKCVFANILLIPFIFNIKFMFCICFIIIKLKVTCIRETGCALNLLLDIYIFISCGTVALYGPFFFLWFAKKEKKKTIKSYGSAATFLLVPQMFGIDRFHCISISVLIVN